MIVTTTESVTLVQRWNAPASGSFAPPSHVIDSQGNAWRVYAASLADGRYELRTTLGDDHDPQTRTFTFPDPRDDDPTDTRPHSRACGIRPHPHGSQCAVDCPTCREDT